MTDNELKVRAGLNVGNQPGFLTFVQKAGCKSTVVPTNGVKTTILEGVEGGHRSMYVQMEAPSALIVNGALADYDWTLWFEDDEGNQMAIDTGSVIAAVPPVVGVTSIMPPLNEVLFALAPGEKFLLSCVPAVAP